MISATEAREAVHVLLLRELVQIRDGRAVILKGGVNLRLFYDSPRYSEDMDLDGEPETRLAIRSRIRQIFDDREFLTSLRRLGLRGLDPKEGPNKDTEVTFRYKFHVLAPGEQSYGTKVEVSFRERDDAYSYQLTRPDPGRLERYLPGEPGFSVQRYDRASALRQKIEALAGRTRIEARDIFDLNWLLDRAEVPRRKLVPLLADAIEATTLRVAYQRAFQLEYSEYESLVVRFLEDDVRQAYRSESRWDELRLRAGSLIEDIREEQERRA